MISAPHKLPSKARKRTTEKDICPLAIRTPAGGSISSLGKGKNELSIVIPIKIPRYPSEFIKFTRDSISVFKIDII